MSPSFRGTIVGPESTLVMYKPQRGPITSKDDRSRNVETFVANFDSC